ncbi:helix-turn-helix transcriptional regulator [Roseateles sp. So40a]|uniref:helix-turn-helix transcriptional regulator n=1 Tax=Roseateles sp. So40a TaxID=3400226 RepID=UPI003A898198
MSKDELASILKVTVRTITNYVRRGALPAPVKVGRKALWRRATIERLLESLDCEGALQLQANAIGKALAEERLLSGE